MTKEAALKYIEAGEKAAIDRIPKIKRRVFKSEDMMESIQSFVQRRSAVFRGTWTVPRHRAADVLQA